MKKYFVIGLAMAALSSCEAVPSDGLGNILGGISEQLGGQSAAGLSNFEIESGLRQALEIGATNVSSQLGASDGFFGDDQIRIPLPGRLGDIQDRLQTFGLSAPLDDLQLRMNRAAEASMPEARRLVVSAVQSITLEDAVGILQGGDSAATDFLRGKTETNLREAFSPFVDDALQSSGAFQALSGVAASNGLGGLTTSLQGDMRDHAVNLGLDGMFYYVALEEQKIRENPVARTTELLRKVFGANG